jgi:hypothetical protein
LAKETTVKTFHFDPYNIFGYLECGLLAVMELELTVSGATYWDNQLSLNTI